MESDFLWFSVHLSKAPPARPDYTRYGPGIQFPDAYPRRLDTHTYRESDDHSASRFQCILANTGIWSEARIGSTRASVTFHAGLASTKSIRTTLRRG